MTVKVCFVFAILPILLTGFATCGIRADNRIRRIPSGDDNFVISVVTNGTYSLLINGVSWLNSAPTFFNANNKTFSSADKSLVLNQTTGTSGKDKLGQWQSTNFVYHTGDSKGVQITATIKTYPELPIVIFEQNYDEGAMWAQASNYDGVCGGFPGFQLEGPPELLGYLSYGGMMFGDTHKKIGTWYYQTTKLNEGVDGGPLAIFDREGRTLIISPFNNFMSASFSHDKDVGGNYYAGVMGGVSTIPAKHSQQFIVYYAHGINKAFEGLGKLMLVAPLPHVMAFEGWGKLMRGYYDKDPGMQSKDLTVTHLGYWTDNGAYYYYNTEKSKTYEQTVLDVKAYTDTMKIPYRYFQYDSWWYYKGKGDGVKTWWSRPDVFPDGFVNVSKKMMLPAAAHNRYWASDTTYAKQNGGTYDFVVESYKALPLTQKFWEDLFDQGKMWGLTLYEQDWLNVEFAGLNYLLHEIDAGTNWLTNMADAATAKGIFIQYCMSNPRHAMQALLYPAVTQARVSDDYSPGQSQWKIGISSIFAAAMGVAPYKDTFWTTETQPGNPYKRSEPNWKLNAVVSTLSTGPVGPSDMIGATNVPMLMKCCRQDGMILKPQFPARAIDKQILKAAFPADDGPDGEVWVSYTDITGLRFSQLLVLDLANGTQYTVYPSTTGIYDNVTDTDLYAVPYDEPEGWVTFSSIAGLTFTDKFNPTRIALYYISQAIPGWFQTVILGELDKWVPVSRQRVLDITWTKDKVMAPLTGAPGETFNFWYILGSKQNSVNCTLDSAGTAMFTMDSKLGIATC